MTNVDLNFQSYATYLVVQSQNRELSTKKALSVAKKRPANIEAQSLSFRRGDQANHAWPCTTDEGNHPSMGTKRKVDFSFGSQGLGPAYGNEQGCDHPSDSYCNLFSSSLLSRLPNTITSTISRSVSAPLSPRLSGEVYRTPSFAIFQAETVRDNSS